MSNIFAGQYKLTDDIYRSPVVLFQEDDTGMIYILKNRYPDNKFIDGKYLSYFDIPREFFENKKSLRTYEKFNINNSGQIIEVLNVIVNGPLFRTFVFDSKEVEQKDFVEELKEKEMERSSETIETTSEDDSDGKE